MGRYTTVVKVKIITFSNNNDDVRRIESTFQLRCEKNEIEMKSRDQPFDKIL